jgi:transposase
MLHIDTDTKYYWFHGSVDFRKAFDSLSGLIQEFLRREVTDGGFLIFVKLRRNANKPLKWEGDDMPMYHKRLEQGVFEDPKKSVDGKQIIIDANQLSLILQGIRLSIVVRNLHPSSNRKLLHVEQDAIGRAFTKCRMNRAVHVRFCGKAVVKFPA